MSDNMNRGDQGKREFRGGQTGKREGSPAHRGEAGRFAHENRPRGMDQRGSGSNGKSWGNKSAFRGCKSSDEAEKRPFYGDKVGNRAKQESGRGGDRGNRGGFRGDHRPGGGGRPGYRGTPRPAPKPAQTDGLPARRIALAVLREVTENGAYASLCLDDKLTKSGLSPADRRLAARLAYDTLEHLLTIDHALSQVMAKPDTDIKLRNVLRLGACQILLEDRIPESAATNTSVNLCKELGMEGLAGVCNGILRNLIRQKDALQWPDPEKEPVRALSIKYSVPEWLVERLIADWGREEAEAMMGYHEPETYITIRPNMTEMDSEAFEALLAKKVWEHEKGSVPFSWRIRGMADVGQDADFLAGRFSIQGESSMLACMALNPKRGSQILDACAAPGGKTCLLAEMMGGTGRVQAWEMHEHRTALINAQMKRLHLENIRPMTRDASVHRPDLDQTMDAVLLDAPCSGLGVMADKPDVKYRVTAQSVEELTALQGKLLDAVAPYVKKGGTLVYSTCSILKAENVEQIEAFLQRHPEFELDALPESIPEKFRQYADTGLQLTPRRDGVGGFYICRMRRKRA